jgi:hypothetical protein
MKTKITSLLFLTAFIISVSFTGNQAAAFASPVAERQVVPAVKATGKGIYRGGKYIGKRTWRGSRWVGLKVARGGKWVAVKTARGVKWVFVGNKKSRKP